MKSQIPTVRCKEGTCRAEFVYVLNPVKGTRVPVDVDTFSQEELTRMNHTGDVGGIYFDPTRHKNHFFTCTNPGRFSRHRKRQGKKPVD